MAKKRFISFFHVFCHVLCSKNCLMLLLLYYSAKCFISVAKICLPMGLFFVFLFSYACDSSEPNFSRVLFTLACIFLVGLGL